MHLLPPFLRKYGIIPESYKIAMTYEEQLLWLCKHLEDIEAEFEEFKGTEGSLVELVRSFDGRITKNTEDIAELSENQAAQTLDSDLDVTNNLQLINSGPYYTGDYKVKAFNEDFQTYMTLVPEKTLFAYYQDYNMIIPLYDYNQNKSLKKFYEYDAQSNTWNLTNYEVSTEINSQSSDYDIPTGKAVYDFVQSQSGGGTEVKTLEGNVVLNAGFTITGLTTGFYETEEYAIYLHSQTAGNELFSNELVYYDMDNNIFIGSLKTVYYEGLAMDWVIAENGAVENSLSNSRSKIPTSQAVKTYVDSHSGGNGVITPLTQNVTLTDGTTPFTEGLYYTGNYAVINTNSVTMIDNHTLFYYNATSNEMLTIYEKEFNTKLGEKVWFYISATNRWGSNQYKVLPYVSSSSANDEIPTSKAVYEATLHTYSTTEKVVGTWIDGKPLYEKVASITMDHTGNQGGYNTGDLVSNNIGYGTIVSVFTTGHAISTNLYNGYNSNIQNTIYIEGNSTNANYGYLQGFTSYSQLVGVPIYVVCRYTKTTD